MSTLALPLGSPAAAYASGTHLLLHGGGEKPAFLRADYQYATDYVRTTGPGTVSYQAVVYQGDAARNLNARLGVQFDTVEASVFASNLTNENTVLGVGNTSPSVIVTETAVRPREIGVTLSYRR